MERICPCCFNLIVVASHLHYFNHERWCLKNPKREYYASQAREHNKARIPWNKGKTLKTDERIAKQSRDIKHLWVTGQLTGRPQTEKTKRKISLLMMGNTRAHHRGDRQSFYKSTRMDSSWEVKTAEYLEKNQIDFTYSGKTFSLSDKRTYTPDFQLSETHYIEVKGYFRKENKQKFEQFKAEYPHINIELWDKTILIEKKIL